MIKMFNSNCLHYFNNLLKLFVRSFLEYHVSAWMLYQVGGIKKIESVQVTFKRSVLRKINVALYVKA